MIEHLMLPPEKPLKILSGEPRPCGQPCKDVLGKWIKPDILSQPKKRVKMNETVADISNLKVNSLEFVESITTVL